MWLLFKSALHQKLAINRLNKQYNHGLKISLHLNIT
jgi:hypothetical protein